MRRENIIQILGKSHAVEVLRALKEGPKRFLDLKEVCNSNRTRSARLRELESKGLVKTIAKIVGRRAYTFYELTPIGREALELCEKLLRLERNIRSK